MHLSESDKKTGVPDDKACVSDNKTGVPDDNTGVPDDDTGITDDDTGVPDANNSVADDNTGIADDDTGVPVANNCVVDDNTGVPDDKSDVADDDSDVAGNELLISTTCQPCRTTPLQNCSIICCYIQTSTDGGNYRNITKTGIAQPTQAAGPIQTMINVLIKHCLYNIYIPLKLF